MPMHFYPNKNYTPLYFLLAVGAICGMSIAGPVFIKPAFNRILAEMALGDFEKGYQEVQHPPGTEHLAQQSTSGVFGGGEQGCDLFLGEVRRYDGNQDVILAAYTHQAVEGNPVQVVFLDGSQIPGGAVDALPEPLQDLESWELPSDAAQQPLYMVYLIILDYEGDQKLNCR